MSEEMKRVIVQIPVRILAKLENNFNFREFVETAVHESDYDSDFEEVEVLDEIRGSL